jgi:hypothetical protein
LIRIEDISKNNIEDVFDICSLNRSFAPRIGPILLEGRNLKKKWLMDMLALYGSCTKIAYFKEKPTAQILFYPEEAMPFLTKPRKDTIYLQCIFNPISKFQRRGVGGTLIKSLIKECNEGLNCLEGKKCNFIITKPFLHEGTLPLKEFYSKYGFKQTNNEMYLEITENYVSRDIPPFQQISEDQGKIILSYVPRCEWGYYYAISAKNILKEVYPEVNIIMNNVWEYPEEFMKRPHQNLIAGSTIADAKLVNDSFFWVDKENYLRNVEKAMKT